MEKEIKIGYCYNYYPHKRNIINKVSNFSYRKVINLSRYKKFIVKIINKYVSKKINSNAKYIFCDYGFNNVNILHFFNLISYGKTPWITTFETMTPRFEETLACHHGRNPSYSSLIKNKNIIKAVKAISSSNCKRIIAMSNCAAKIQLSFLDNFPTYKPTIEKKILVLHPPQKILIDNLSVKEIKNDEAIVFTFVGRSFFRKGGMDILKAFIEFKAKNNNLNLKLIIISKLQVNNYATRENEYDIEVAKKLIQENSDWIEYHYELENNKVLEILRKTHVGLLPTYADTYGYSVLEFQASGCPVISTDIRALTEVNNDETGWIIQIPKNNLGEAIYSTKSEIKDIGKKIQTELISILEKIFFNKDIIKIKAEKSIQRIKNFHSPEKYSRKLKKIYEDALL